MRKSDLEAAAAPPPAAPPPIPVICERCRAEGLAGDDPFAHLADLLDFTPVVRRGRADGWTPEKQRAFIAALVVTGSPRRAAAAIGKHENGATQLKKARGSGSFVAAWDAALELARERELAALKDGLIELAEEHDEDYHRRRCALVPRSERQTAHPEPVEGLSALACPGPRSGGNPIHPECDYDPEWHTADYPEYWQAKQRIRQRFLGARRIFLAIIANNAAKRAAWETLCGPTDWELASRFEPQPVEPVHPNVHQPDMQLLGESGCIADFVGGEDKMAPVRRQLLGIDEAADDPRSSPNSPGES